MNELQDHICEECEDVIDDMKERHVVFGDADDPYQTVCWYHTGCYHEYRKRQKLSRATARRM